MRLAEAVTPPTELPVKPMHARNAAAIIVLAAAYFVAAKLGLRLAFVNASATAVWPPTGIALAALLLFGPRVWPGVLLGAFLANVTTAGNIATSAAIAAGNTLEGLIATYLVNRFAHGGMAFSRAADIFRFALLAAVLSTAVSATVGVTSLSLAGFARWADYGVIWLTWWLGDASAALILTPFIVLWATQRDAGWSRERVAEAVLLVLAMVLVAGVVFSAVYPFAYLTVPVLVWAAFRFGPRDTATVIVLFSVFAIWGTLQGRGPFVAPTQNESLFMLQAFMAIMCLVNLPVSAVVAEQKRAEAQLRDSERRFRALYQRDHSVVEILQRSFLPDGLPDIPGVAVASRYVPAAPEALGGDWYDVLSLSDGRVGVAVGDVAGRGVEAAAVMGKLRTAIRAFALEGHPPTVLVERVRAIMGEDEMAALIYLILDPATGEVSYMNAGNPPPLVITPAGSVQRLVGDSLPLNTPLQPMYEERSATLPAGSVLLLYTDGLIEAKTRVADASLERLERIAMVLADGDLDKGLDRLIDGAREGAQGNDDIAVLAIRLTPLDAQRFSVQLAAAPSSLPVLRRALGRWLSAAGAEPDMASRIMVAVGEAATNAIEHAYGPADAPLLIEAHTDQAGITVAVHDRGRWRPSRGAGGRGIGFMHALVDRVEIVRGEDGTTVRLFEPFDSRART
jgi:integral membrane sensor domain MASE1/anti-sigma regulatory factor (Ser/Thr protein kinase)